MPRSHTAERLIAAAAITVVVGAGLWRVAHRPKPLHPAPMSTPQRRDVPCPSGQPAP